MNSQKKLFPQKTWAIKEIVVKKCLLEDYKKS